MRIEDVWPEWKAEKKIGRGSYGTVYKCFKEENGEKVYSAIKVISVPGDDVELMSSPSLEHMSAEQSKVYYREIMDDFLHEIEILESLRGHPNIVRIDDSKIVEDPDQVGWHLFIRMELLTDFNTYSCDRVFTEKDVIKLASDLANALKACAAKNIVHRDIKPENIFVDESVTFKLGDFGVAKHLECTQTAMSRKGTPNYMAPEVLSAQQGDSRADIYSLGIVMYQLLNNNRFPFMDPNKQFITHSERERAFKRRSEQGEQIPDLLHISPDLNAVVRKATQFKKEDRFRNINEFANALNRLNKKEKAEEVRRIGWTNAAAVSRSAAPHLSGKSDNGYYPHLRNRSNDEQSDQRLKRTQDSSRPGLPTSPIENETASSCSERGCCTLLDLTNHKLYSLTDVCILIGRSPGCDLVLPSSTVSRRHAVLLLNKNGWTVDDAGSTFGTFLNGTKVTKPHTLFDGDVLQLGNVRLRFNAEKTNNK